ncbi:ATP-dependent metalloprotease [Gregarina niphandrodes]|uniref:ATP-dependent metalloprotease n=1 Tax=Gregarina niphandrodes TaxID=110365 RepID=A0A023B881_GRENI|nr:ATP-dependent metalloprotease [Gregarina niphandrodes]EZG68305.1 ATP-dependent metalloprotease [Gregarina niphandrodes]|eukprot:XP_011134591.1 ATP-dependent metalloprotease [Gregarina niphandrodes]
MLPGKVKWTTGISFLGQIGAKSLLRAADTTSNFRKGSGRPLLPPRRRLTNDIPPLLTPPTPRINTIELPLLSVITIFASLGLWLLTGEHDRVKAESMISMKEFMYDYLRRGKVDRLQVIGQDHVRVVLKDEQPFDLNGCIDGVVKAIEVLGGKAADALGMKLSSGGTRDGDGGPKASVREQGERRKSLRRALYGHLVRLVRAEDFAEDKRFVRFKVGDLNQLETLLRLYTSKIPPVYYLDCKDRIQTLRNVLPSVALAAMSFVRVRRSQPETLARLHRDYYDRANAPTQTQLPDNLLKFGQAQHKPPGEVPNVRFSDVAGLEQAKLEVQEFVDFLKHPEKYTSLGAQIPKGALLVGPPGTGKTLLARAIAGEAGVPFYSTSGSDFIEMFVGVGASRIRDLFAKARKNAPAIVFIDEIDTIGRARAGANHLGNGGTDERESTLNALLVELDGFSANANVITLAGTNRGDVLDRALTRPGRFDRQIALAKPSIKERLAIFEIYLRPLKLEDGMRGVAQRLAALTPGFSGAEIKNVCNEGAILAARRDADSVALGDLEQAVERLVGGLRHTGDVLSPELRAQVALHEAGHAVAAWFLPEADPVLKLSVVPRASGALGYTQTLPDDLLLSKKETLEDKICTLLAGRAAEHLFSQTVTTGASDDLERATKLCQAYVQVFGFDRVLGLRSYQQNEQSLHTTYSDATAKQIDDRVSQLLRYQWTRCLDLLTSKQREVRQLADTLLEHEVISFNDMVRYLRVIRYPRGEVGGDKISTGMGFDGCGSRSAFWVQRARKCRRRRVSLWRPCPVAS